MKKYALIFILFISILMFHSGSAAAVSFYVGDQPVDLPRPLVVVNGNILVPASILPDYLLARIDYDPDQGKADIDFLSGESVCMTAGQLRAQVNGVEQELETAPVAVEGHLMIPLRFIADLLGYSLVFDNEQIAIVLIPSPDMIEAIGALKGAEAAPSLPVFYDPAAADDFLARPILKDIAYLGGPRSRVFLDIQGYPSYTSYLLSDPNRLIIELDAAGGSIPALDIGDAIISRVYTERAAANILRVIFDLKKKSNYDITPWPQGGLDVKFNYQVSDIGYYRDEDGVPRLWLEALDQPSLEKLVLYSPMRLVLDLKNTTFMSQAKEIIVADDPAVKSIRISQHTPSITRLIFDLVTHIEPVEVEKVGDRFEIILFEGTLEEYQAILDQIEPEPTPELAPADGTIPLDQVLVNRVISIDPGHGGSDPGTVGVTGVFEKDVALAVSLKLGALLEEAGVLVVYTRQEDHYVSKFDRPKIAELSGAELFISIHANWFEGNQVKGMETLYNPLYLENFRLAQAIQSELSHMVATTDRGVRPRTDLAVLNNLAIPAVLVEVGFVSNVEEERLLAEAEYQDQIALGLFEGIQLFFANYLSR